MSLGALISRLAVLVRQTRLTNPIRAVHGPANDICARKSKTSVAEPQKTPNREPILQAKDHHSQ